MHIRSNDSIMKPQTSTTSDSPSRSNSHSPSPSISTSISPTTKEKKLELSLSGRGLSTLPLEIISEHAHQIVKLDLSDNQLKSVQFISRSTIFFRNYSLSFCMWINAYFLELFINLF